MNNITFPCSVNSLPFYPSISMRRSIDAMINFGQSSYIESLLQWQSKLPYKNKRLFNDTITVQFKTQANSPVLLPPITTSNSFAYTNLAQFHVCSSKIGNEGYPIPDSPISGFDTLFNPILSAGEYPISLGSQFWGVQSAQYDTYVDPILGGTPTSLASYMWQFKFSDVLNYLTDSGIYFLRFDNISQDGTTKDIWYSEPILVYGNDAKKTFPTTLVFECANLINKNDIIIDNWFNHSGEQVVMGTRVEADILEYQQKGIYLGFLQQDWLPQNTYNKSWKVWNLSIGSISSGVPAVMFEIITKIMEMDYILINNQYYNYDVTSGGSQSASDAWKMEKSRVKGLFRGLLPVRYRFDNQFYASSPINLPRIFDGTFDPTFG